LLAILLAGAALRLMGFLFRWSRLAGLTGSSRPLDDDADLLSRVRFDAERLGVAAPPIRVSNTAEPLLAGVLRPVILIPGALRPALTTEKIALICAHELAHLKCGDHFRVPLEQLIGAAFWFNPLMGAVRTRLSAAREEVCDSLVLGDGHSDRRVYAQTLVGALRVGAAQPHALAFTGFRMGQVRRRIIAILRPAASSRPAAIGAAGLATLLGLTVGGLSVALAAEPIRSVRKLANAVHALPALPAEVSSAPASAPVKAAEPQLAQAANQSVRFEIRVITGADSVMQDALSGQKVNGFSFVVSPRFSSTYEGGPQVRLAGSVDAALASFSPNELRIQRVADVVVRSGDNRLVEGEQFRGSGMPMLFGPAPIQFYRDGKLVGFATGGVRDPAAKVLFELELRPRVRGGAVQVTVTPRQKIPEQPIMKTILDESACETPPDGPKRCRMQFEPTGETRAAQSRERTATFTLKDGEVLAIGGLNPVGLANGARSYSGNNAVVLIRPVVERVRGA
jgi:hypothetical protein